MATVDPTRVFVSFGGAPISGFAEGTYINIEQRANSFDVQIGADGEACFIKNADNSHTVEITLQQASPANDILSAFLTADKLVGSGMKPLFIKDGNGTSVFTDAQARIMKTPGQEQAKEVKDRKWTFICPNPIENVGGVYVP